MGRKRRGKNKGDGDAQEAEGASSSTTVQETPQKKAAAAPPPQHGASRQKGPSQPQRQQQSLPEQRGPTQQQSQLRQMGPQIQQGVPPPQHGLPRQTGPPGQPAQQQYGPSQPMQQQSALPRQWGPVPQQGQIPPVQWGPPPQSRPWGGGPPQQQIPPAQWGPSHQQNPPRHRGPQVTSPPRLGGPQTISPPRQWGPSQQQQTSGQSGQPLPQQISTRPWGQPSAQTVAQQQQSQQHYLQTEQKMEQVTVTTLPKMEVESHGRGRSPVSQEPPQQSQGRGKQSQKQGQRPGGKPTTSPPLGDSHKILAKQERITSAHGDSIDLATKIQQAGKKGRQIAVLTNHFPLSMGKVKQAIHYDVAIDPDKPKKAMRIVMEQFGKRHFPGFHPAYDGMKNMYSPSDLPFGESTEGTVQLILDEGAKPKEYKVKVKKVAVIDLTVIAKYLASVKDNLVVDIPMNALQVIEIVLRHSFATRSINVGRSLFSMPLPGSKVISLGNGMEMYRGTYQAVNLGWKPFVNIDIVNKAFPQAMNVIELIKQLGRKGQRDADLYSPLDRNTLEALDKHIRGLRVNYCIPNNPSSKKVYRVNCADECPRKLMFKKDDRSAPISVETYFLEKKVRLQYPLMPCLWVGSQQGNIKVPAEFCTVLPGQVVNKKLGPFETREMIRHCATDTMVRRTNIHQSLKIANFNQDPTIKSFDMSVATEFQEINARVLNPPDLLYGNNQVVKVQKGVWNAGVFFNGAKINSWTILNLDRRTEQRNLDDLVKNIKNSARQLRVNISDQFLPPTNISGFPNPELLRKLKDYFDDKRRKGVSIVFVVIPEMDKIYNYVKEASEIASACLTQCIKSRTLTRLTPSTVSNILLKVNAKLNGTNHLIQDLNPLMRNEITMIMGADVTHPSPDSRDIPSVAAVTASHEPRAFQYNICWKLQPPKVEVIQEMEAVTREQILYFARKNNTPPARIIFYRDGVSDGQFRDVLRSELLAIRKACGVINPSYKPKITFLVVQKRHHTRLFPKDSRDSQDKNCNVPAGTCVDTEIVNPTCQNFFLVSHASIQGVAKPTKYVTLWDDSEFSSDEIESLTYYLCHMFARCNRSVSYPAPTYYAHLAAARAKAYIETKRLNMDRLPDEEKKLTVNNAIIKDLPMFFI